MFKKILLASLSVIALSQSGFAEELAPLKNTPGEVTIPGPRTVDLPLPHDPTAPPKSLVVLPGDKTIPDNAGAPVLDAPGSPPPAGAKGHNTPEIPEAPPPLDPGQTQTLER